MRGVYPLYSLYSSLRGADPDEMRQRAGLLHSTGQPGALWLQAASVGEVGVATALMEALREADRSLSFYLTTTTRTGQALARRTAGSKARIGYFPLDFRSSVRKIVSSLRPCALILVETEIWPNLLAEAELRRVPVLIVNGRLSDRTFRRYRLLKPLFSRALRGVSYVGVQSELDRQRFLDLGAAAERVRVTGNLKFASARRPPEPASLLTLMGIEAEDELWIGGSTADEEEAALLSAFRGLSPPPRGRRILLIAPRRSERFEAVAQRLAASGLPWQRRSHLPKPLASSARVILLDSVGELSSLYARASVAFVGGTLVPIGGHNIIEPAACAVAPIFGPHIQNVRDVAARLLAVGGAFQVGDAGELSRLFARLAADPSLRRAAGEIALHVVRENSGALEATVRDLVPHLPCGESARA